MFQEQSALVILLTGLIRHGLSSLGVLLTAYGVTKEQVEAGVNELVPMIVGLVLFIVGILWSYLSKQKAFQTPPGE